MAEKYSHDELVGKIKSPGWELVDDKKKPAATGTLEHLLHLTHAQKAKGERPGLIRQIETEIEVDLIQLGQLWRYLGLPT